MAFTTVQTFFCAAVLFHSAVSQWYPVSEQYEQPYERNLYLRSFYGDWFVIYQTSGAPLTGLKDSSFTFVPTATIASSISLVVANGCSNFTKHLRINDPLQPARMVVSYDNGNYNSDFIVLDTDYKQYAVIYSDIVAAPPSFQMTERHLWILSRTTSLSDLLRDQIYEIISKSVGLPQTVVNRVSHDQTSIFCFEIFIRIIEIQIISFRLQISSRAPGATGTSCFDG